MFFSNTDTNCPISDISKFSANPITLLLATDRCLVAWEMGIFC
jgi:hypothetical protein